MLTDERSQRRFIKGAIVFAVLLLFAQLAFWGGVIYVALHFLAKIW